jgi:glyoxylase-like metal-dependent hydrolase (beta-lactamase superfamily II)
MSGLDRSTEADGLHWVNVGYSAANYYLLRTDLVGLLIDVGWPGTLPRLRGSLARAGSDIRSVTHLLCTHYHPDHAGMAEELALLGIGLLVFETQSTAILAMNEYLAAREHFVPVSGRCRIDVRTDASRSFLWGLGIRGEVVATPGHTDDSVSLVLDSGLAFTGDLPPALIGEPGDLVSQSWAKLQARRVREVLPGHGPSRRLSDVVDQSCLETSSP